MMLSGRVAMKVILQGYYLPVINSVSDFRTLVSMYCNKAGDKSNAKPCLRLCFSRGKSIGTRNVFPPSTGKLLSWL